MPRFPRVLTLLPICALLFALPARALAQDAPKVVEPKFPLEPDKKPSKPVDPKSFVEGADEPPPSELEKEASLRERRGADQWWTNWDIGWFYLTQNAQHSFTGPGIGIGRGVKRQNHNILSLGSQLETRTPYVFGAVIGAAASMGDAEAIVSGGNVALTRFSAPDLRARAGLRLHVLPRRWQHDFRLAGYIEGAIQSVTTFSGPDLIDVDSRKVVTLQPRVEYAYTSQLNWGAELSAGIGRLLSASGSGDVKADPYRRIDADVSAHRYVVRGGAIGMGIRYTDERVTWTQTAPFPLQDEVRTQDIRIRFFWRMEI